MADILLFGKDGQVGWELARALAVVGEVVALGKADCDLACGTAGSVIREVAPRIIVNAAAYTAVDRAESEPDLAHRINAGAVREMAEEAARAGALLVHYSTDYVFDGRLARPYREDDAPSPGGVYARSKLDGERAIAQAGCRHLILRVCWVYSARGRNFVKTMLRLASQGTGLSVVGDQWGAPTSAELVADATAACLRRLEAHGSDALLGTYHLAARGETTWCEFARHVLRTAESSGATLKCRWQDIEEIPSSEYPLPAPRPGNSRLDTSRIRAAFGLHLPDWRYHVGRTVAEFLAKDEGAGSTR
ncbi:MAG: dTDP-4-dehydrorhamnose reductase [Rhodocyclaceae bacterium]|nr:dTDP-4-dehydrorhamnose reductase [Rhodocyclaceae bacterium]